ncbi:MAG: NTP transferase domain-containing protein [Steroidobacteraceae bacterium]
MSLPPLFGLVLAGGTSSRMQRDKAALAYHGKPQLQWAYELLERFTTATFGSVRPDQRDDELRRSLPQIVDRHPGIGPLAGIEAALLSHPKAAWLVVACDLPFLDARTLELLVQNRDGSRIATAFRSAHDGLPEPLCAIWEPRSSESVAAVIAANRSCPRKLLINSDARLLDLPDARALDNINTSQEFGEAQSALRAPVATSNGSTVNLRVQYYALFREQAGRSEESVSTTARTPAALYAELQSRHPFKLAPEQLKVAINADFRDWSTPLTDGDTVVFIPPVAGG